MANDKRWENDFREFLDAEGTAVPRGVAERVYAGVEARLHPSFGQVLAKLAVIQAAAGVVSLAFCPQFGLSLTDHTFMPLMSYGETACMIACGALFTGLSLLIASFALQPEEVRTLRRQRLLQVATMAALSLGAFVCAGGEVLVGLGLVWVSSAIVGGVATLELGWSIRRLSYGKRF